MEDSLEAVILEEADEYVFSKGRFRSFILVEVINLIRYNHPTTKALEESVIVNEIINHKYTFQFVQSLS